MIPASYLFRDVYQQHWETEALPDTEPHPVRFRDGLLTPLRILLTQLLQRHGKPGRIYFGTHAYD